MAIDNTNPRRKYQRKHLSKEFPALRYTGEKQHGTGTLVRFDMTPAKIKQRPTVKRDPPPPRPPIDMDTFNTDCDTYKSSIPRNVPRLNATGLQLNLSPEQYKELIGDIRTATDLSITRIDECVEACAAIHMFMLRNEIDPAPYIKAGVKVRKR